MADETAEMVLLNKMLDEAFDDELTLGCEDDGEMLLIGAVIPFMRRILNRSEGFYEVVVPGYCVDEFRSHFRMTKNAFEALCREVAATGLIPRGNRFGRRPISVEKQLLVFVWYVSNLHTET